MKKEEGPDTVGEKTAEKPPYQRAKTTDILIRRVPLKLRQTFYARCVLDDVTMRDVFIQFMREVLKSDAEKKGQENFWNLFWSNVKRYRS